MRKTTDLNHFIHGAIAGIFFGLALAGLIITALTYFKVILWKL